MATKVTSARPIISAAAVDAVRPGWRTAFSRARRPAAPPRLRAGSRPARRAAARAGGDQRDPEEQQEHADDGTSTALAEPPAKTP